MVTDTPLEFSGPDYVEMLRAIHSWKKPKAYLEIASGHNRTLALAECRTISIGRPQFIQNKDISSKQNPIFLFQMDSLEFFESSHAKDLFPDPIDLAFLDGIHLCEVLLIEFLNVEKIAKPDSVIALHDCLPLEVGITGRNATLATPQDPKRRGWWLGDVWRTALFLKRNRPDLVIRAYAAPPTGLVCITGLDPKRPFSKDDIARAKAEMLGYDLSKIGIQQFLAELEVENATLDVGRLDKALTPTPIRQPKPDGRDRVVALIRAAAPHNLKTATLKDAKLQAFRGPAVHYQGGLVLTSDNDALRHLHCGKPADNFESEIDCKARLSGDYIYGGPIYLHFGHFISEFVHRILPSYQTFGSHPFVFVAQKGTNKTFESLPSWLHGIFDFLGITSRNAIIVNEDTEVERLHVSQLGSHLGVESEKSYLDLLSDFGRIRIQDYAGRWASQKKIYVSRSGIEHGGNFLGERYLEYLLADAGYHIMRPETLSFPEQIWLYSQAEEIIFCEGSACHGCELFGSSTLGRVFLLAKRELNTFTRVLRPRSRHFYASHGHHAVGTLGRTPAGKPLQHVGVHLLKAPLLLKSLQESDFVDLRGAFSRQAYIEAASRDLLEYVRFYLTRDVKAATRALDPGDVADLLRSYQTLVDEQA